MKITYKKLQDKNACSDGIAEFNQLYPKGTQLKTLIQFCIDNHKKNDNYLSWANWAIGRFMTKKQRLAYAIFAAEQVIDIYKKHHPNDNRPQRAIDAGKKVLKYNSQANRSAADAAAYAAAGAYADAADAAAADAAYAAAAAAAYADAADAAYAAAGAAAAYAAAGGAAGGGAKTEMKIKILKHGLTLLK